MSTASGSSQNTGDSDQVDNVPDRFLGQPMPFHGHKLSKGALLSSDNCVIEWNDHATEQNEGDCVAYTAHPIRVNNAWRLLLNASEKEGKTRIVSFLVSRSSRRFLASEERLLAWDYRCTCIAMQLLVL